MTWYVNGADGHHLSLMGARSHHRATMACQRHTGTTSSKTIESGSAGGGNLHHTAHYHMCSCALRAEGACVRRA
jgi:hypothetical protein